MKRLNSKLIIGGVLISALLMNSCSKFNQDDNKEDAAEIVIGTMIDIDLFPEEVYAAYDCELNHINDLAEGVIVTESSATFPKTVTFDYGTGCLDKWGKTRKGKVNVIASGLMSLVGSTTQITYENFSINDFIIKGTRSAENIGPNSVGHPVIKYAGTIEFSKNSRTRTYTFNNQREFIIGSGTCDVSDDEFLITGSGSMNTCSKRTVPLSISTPIHYSMRECLYPFSGKIDIGSSNRGVIIDFGNGDCDNLAEIQVKRRNKNAIFNLETREIIQ